MQSDIQPMISLSEQVILTFEQYLGFCYAYKNAFHE